MPQNCRCDLRAGFDAATIYLAMNRKQRGSELAEAHPFTAQSARPMAFGVQCTVYARDDLSLGIAHHVKHGVGKGLYHCGDAIASAAVGEVKTVNVFPAMAGIFDMFERFLENASPLVADVVPDGDALNVPEKPIHRRLHDGAVALNTPLVVAEKGVTFGKALKAAVGLVDGSRGGRQSGEGPRGSRANDSGPSGAFGT